MFTLTEEMDMTNTATAVEAVHHGVQGTIHLPPRLKAAFRLIAMRRHRRTLTAALQFADARMQADVGLGKSDQRLGWFEAFLASQAAR